MEYHSYVYQNDLANAQLYAPDIIGNLNAGMNLFLDWNLVLNQKGGPNHTGNYCDAPILCDVKRNEIKKQLSYTCLLYTSYQKCLLRHFVVTPLFLLLFILL